MHRAIQNFSNYQDDERVIDQVVKFNSEFYKVNLELDKTLIFPQSVKEGDRGENFAIHQPHIRNMYEDKTISKLIAIHILSSRDDIQGGEFRFASWGEPQRKDNYGKLVPTKNPYPVWLNEQGSLFVIPALENVSTERVVSGQLDFIQYVFRGANYK